MRVQLAQMQQAALFHECRDCGALGAWYRSRITGEAVCHACQRAGSRLSPPPLRGPVRRHQVPETVAAAIRAKPCAWCHAPGPSQVDHIQPLAAGGTDDPDNLQPLCQPCNQSKGNRPMAVWAATADGTRRYLARNTP